MLTTLFGPSRLPATLTPTRRAENGDILYLDSNDGWTTLGGGLRMRTRAGVSVDEETALTYSAVWCATRVLAEAVSMLPAFIYRRRADDDGRDHATDLAAYDLLHSMPNPEMDSTAFREGRVAHQVNWGGGFAEIERE